MKVRARLVGIAATGVALLTLGACGNPIARISTERAVSNAFDKALAQPGLNLQVSLGITAAQLQKINQVEHGSRSLTTQEASALARMSIVVDAYSGHGESIQSKQFQADRNNQLQLTLQEGGGRLLELRFIQGAVFARADLQGLLTDFGQDPSAAAQSQSELRTADGYLPGLADLAKGKWVSVDRQQWAMLLQMSGLNGSSAGANSARATALVDHLKSALTDHTSYQSRGDHGGRTEYQLTVQARTVLREISGDLPNLAGSAGGVSGQMTQDLSRALAQAPQTAVVQLWVKDNTAQELDIDINQFVHQFPFAVPVRIAITPGSPIAVPAGATPVQLSKLGGLLGGLGAIRPAPTQAS
jgi:hypothetical protein